MALVNGGPQKIFRAVSGDLFIGSLHSNNRAITKFYDRKKSFELLAIGNGDSYFIIGNAAVRPYMLLEVCLGCTSLAVVDPLISVGHSPECP